MSDHKIKHLEFIQNIITRMNSNSFLIKGWSVTLVSALFALAAKDANIMFVLIAYFPATMFWLLDSFYLHQEKLFRKLYELVIKNDSKVPVYSLDTSLVKPLVKPYIRVVFSKTILPFHSVLIGVIVIVMYVIKT